MRQSVSYATSFVSFFFKHWHGHCDVWTCDSVGSSMDLLCGFLVAMTESFQSFCAVQSFGPLQECFVSLEHFDQWIAQRFRFFRTCIVIQFLDCLLSDFPGEISRSCHVGGKLFPHFELACPHCMTFDVHLVVSSPFVQVQHQMVSLGHALLDWGRVPSSL